LPMPRTSYYPRPISLSDLHRIDTMEAKGTAVLSRRAMVIKEMGEEGWNTFLSQLGEQDVYFRQTILATTLVPIDKFLLFNDGIVDLLFHGDRNAYWTLGEQGARFATGPRGPYSVFLSNPDLKKIVEIQWPKLWNAYLGSDSIFESKLEGRIAQTRFAGLPCKHPYFEYFIVAYYRTTLQIVGYDPVTLNKIKGWDSEDGEVVYQYSVGERRVAADSEAKSSGERAN
jgi:hypothetical protein